MSEGSKPCSLAIDFAPNWPFFNDDFYQILAILGIIFPLKQRDQYSSQENLFPELNAVFYMTPDCAHADYYRLLPH